MHLPFILIMEVNAMEPQSRCYPYERSIVINALYDTIDALGLSLDSANSERGTLIVSDTKHFGSLRIALSGEGRPVCTQVVIFSHDSDLSLAKMWSPVILDELSGTIQKASHIERRCQ